VDFIRRQRSKSVVIVFELVPLEKSRQWPRASTIVPKCSGKTEAILERFELCLAKGIVVGYMRPRMGFGDAEIREQKRDVLRGHLRAAVSVNRQRSRANVLTLAGFRNGFFCELGVLAVRDHLTDDITAEYIQNDVEVKVTPLRGTVQLGNIPTPQPIETCGEQFGLGVRRVPKLVAPHPLLSVLGENAVHRAHRARIAAFICERRVYLGQRQVGKAWLV
jgi:hypothetical protein